MAGIAHLGRAVTVLPDDRISSALTGVGSRLEGIAARTLGLVLALCLAGLAGLLPSDAVAGAFGFVAAGGLIRSRAVVRDALDRAGWRDPRVSGDVKIWPGGTRGAEPPPHERRRPRCCRPLWKLFRGGPGRGRG